MNTNKETEYVSTSTEPIFYAQTTLDVGLRNFTEDPQTEYNSTVSTVSDSFLDLKNITRLFHLSLTICAGLGFTGNLMTLVVVFRKNMRLYSWGVYLAALAIADNLALVALVYNSYYHTSPVSTFGIQYATTTSYWLVVAISIDRLLVVFLPLKVHKFSTRKRAVTVCVLLYIVALLLHGHIFYGIQEVNYGE